MQNIIKIVRKVLPPRRLRFPLLGLMFVVGIVADRSRPVQSNQLDPDPYTYRIVQPQPGVKLMEIQPNYGDDVPFTEQPQTVPNKGNYQSQPIPHHNLDQPPVDAPNWSDIAPGQINNPTLIAATSPNLNLFKPRNSSAINLPQGDGVYLYGQVPEPGQNDRGYIVFEKNNGQLVGALFMPNSEYSCFRGSVDRTGAIAMTVQGYAGESHPVQVAANRNVNLDINAPSPYAHSLALADYYRLPKISSSDRKILRACQSAD